AKLYGVFAGKKWGMFRNKTVAIRAANASNGEVRWMPMPGPGAWDAPTFKVSSEALVIGKNPRGLKLPPIGSARGRRQLLEYEELRQSGITNMMGAASVLGWESERVMQVMQEYATLMTRWPEVKTEAVEGARRWQSVSGYRA
ncbi:hypothetical protein LCGC14_3030680, partial [marine sediment metagenome]